MEILKDLFELLLLLSASSLCISLIFYFLRITRAIEALHRDLERISKQINPLFDTLNGVSKSVKNLSDDIRNQVQKIEWIIDEVKSRVEGILSIEKRVREEIEVPAQNILTTLQALKNGITTFFNVLKK